MKSIILKHCVILSPELSSDIKGSSDCIAHKTCQSRFIRLGRIIGIFTLLLTFLTVFLPLPVKAAEKTGSEVIEEATELYKFKVDPSVSVPDFDLIPQPTPFPTPISEDNRSWKKFIYSSIIDRSARAYNIDPQVIYATIMTESEGDKYAFRYEPHIDDASLCMGQILISTAKSLGFNQNPKELYKPDVCINLIAKYYRVILDDFGELTPLQMATAYNAGSPWNRPTYGHLTRFGYWLNEKI